MKLQISLICITDSHFFLSFLFVIVSRGAISSSVDESVLNFFRGEHCFRGRGSRGLGLQLRHRLAHGGKARGRPLRSRRLLAALPAQVGLERLGHAPVLEQLRLQIARRLAEPLLSLLAPARLQLELLALRPLAAELRLLVAIGESASFGGGLRRATGTTASLQVAQAALGGA